MASNPTAALIDPLRKFFPLFLTFHCCVSSPILFPCFLACSFFSTPRLKRGINHFVIWSFPSRNLSPSIRDLCARIAPYGKKGFSRDVHLSRQEVVETRISRALVWAKRTTARTHGRKNIINIINDKFATGNLLFILWLGYERTHLLVFLNLALASKVGFL